MLQVQRPCLWEIKQNREQVEYREYRGWLDRADMLKIR